MKGLDKPSDRSSRIRECICSSSALPDPKEAEMATIEALPLELREPEARPAEAPCTAEIADCTCPEFCERDHANE
jgi:hypothetical protein